MKINKVQEKELIEKFTTSLINELSKTNKNITLFLAGGSITQSFGNENLHKYLGSIKQKVQILQIDERYTASIKDRNNTSIKESGIIQHVSKYTPILTSDELESIDKYTNEHNSAVMDVLKGDFFTVGLMGIGNDFHTAGIFPNPNKEQFDNLFLTNELVVNHDFGKEPFKERISLSISAMKQIDMFFLFIKGEEKRNVLEYFEKNEIKDKYNSKPSVLYLEHPNVHLFTDLA